MEAEAYVIVASALRGIGCSDTRRTCSLSLQVTWFDVDVLPAAKHSANCV